MNHHLPLSSDPRFLLDKVLTLRSEVENDARTAMLRWSPNISRRSFRSSALNLAAYLALRRRDLRSLQQQLMPWGLSALGCSATDVIANMDSAIAALSAICDQTGTSIHPRAVCAYAYGDRRLERNALAVFGPRQTSHATRIMVTLPPQADDYAFVRKLIDSGMSVARVNCAHGVRDVWDVMIDNIHRAEEEAGKSCKILMDLCGTKPRIATMLLTSGDGRLSAGDTFLLVKDLPRKSDMPVAITCTLPNIIDFLTIGDPVMIDDGKIVAEVIRLVLEGAVIKIIKTSQKGSRLKPQKGLNFPRTIHSLTPLTSKDLTDLDYALRKADSIGCSFVKEAADIALLQREMENRVGCRARGIPIVAKIETSRALDNLPEIIVQGASKQPFSIMIARGDLAVELGFRRLPELQEEILWSAKAAHIPTIWATQVLEGLVKNGFPSRAEMTDAAMAARAECIMLNKGPFLPEAVAFLDDFLPRG